MPKTLRNPQITSDGGSDLMKVQRALTDHVRVINDLQLAVNDLTRRLEAAEAKLQRR